MNAIETLRAALTEIRERILAHPACEGELCEADEIAIGGDTAELSYLARVAREALEATEQARGE